MPPTRATAQSRSPAVELPPAPEIEQTEAYSVLRNFARKKAGNIPAELLARQIMRVTEGGDWPLRKAAMDALLRRYDSARRDRLKVGKRPPGGPPLGKYQTARPRGNTRPYDTVLQRVEPFRGSCNCPDFLTGSLGLCKHLLVVLDELAARPRKFQRAMNGDKDRGVKASGRGGTDNAGRAHTRIELAWEPVRPLLGAGDPLEQLVARPAENGRPRSHRLLGHFRRAEGGELRPRSALLESLNDRAAFIDDLRAHIKKDEGLAANDPALVTLVEQERDRIRRRIAARRNLAERKRALRSLRRKLYPYQREGVERFLAEGRLLLADDMGLGKTIQAVACCHALFNSGAVRRGLLVVPASLKFQWKREWEDTTAIPVHIVEGHATDRHDLYRSRPRGFLIANYEQVLRDLPAILEFEPEMVVLDEAQRIKNWATKTAHHVKRIGSEYRLVLTGTPMENRLDELASIMDWVDARALQPKWRLVPWHTSFVDGAREIAGARHLETLRRRLSHCMLRRRRAEVLKQLPPRTETTIPVEITEAQLEAHRDLDAPIARLLSITKKRSLTQSEFLRLMALLLTQRVIANGMAQLQFEEIWPAISGVAHPDEAWFRTLSSPKLVELRELVSNIAIEQERKIVVFSQWRRMLLLAQWATAPLLRARGLRSAFFTGKEGNKRRTKNLVEFHDDPDLRILFATDAGGVGLNLQRAATCCINLDLPWNPAVLEQRIGRIYRLGQTHPIDVINLVTVDSIEARIARIIEDKRALFATLFDGTSDEVRFGQSGRFLDTLVRISGRESPYGEVDGGDGESFPDDDLDAPVIGDEVEAVVDLADEADDMPSIEPPRSPAAERTGPGAPAPPIPQLDATRVRELLGGIHIERRDDNSLRIEASGDAAQVLGVLFEGFGQMLQKSASRS